MQSRKLGTAGQGRTQATTRSLSRQLPRKSCRSNCNMRLMEPNDELSDRSYWLPARTFSMPQTRAQDLFARATGSAQIESLPANPTCDELGNRNRAPCHCHKLSLQAATSHCRHKPPSAINRSLPRAPRPHTSPCSKRMRRPPCFINGTTCAAGIVTWPHAIICCLFKPSDKLCDAGSQDQAPQPP